MFGTILRLLLGKKPEKGLTREKKRQLEELLQYRIENQDYYVEALTHRSAVDGKRFIVSNERSEFLGDAVLNFIVAKVLYQKFPKKDEGYLTKTRANFVNKNTLFEIAKGLDLFTLLFINKELMVSENFGVRTVLADAFEALIGAIYIDKGIDVAEQFLMRTLIIPYLDLGFHLQDENYKSQLLEFVQAHKMQLPKYIVISEEGPEHNRIFTIQVSVSEEVLGIGRGKSKKSAEQEAAKEAMKRLVNLVS